MLIFWEQITCTPTIYNFDIGYIFRTKKQLSYFPSVIPVKLASHPRFSDSRNRCHACANIICAAHNIPHVNIVCRHRARSRFLPVRIIHPHPASLPKESSGIPLRYVLQYSEATAIRASSVVDSCRVEFSAFFPSRKFKMAYRCYHNAVPAHRRRRPW